MSKNEVDRRTFLRASSAAGLLAATGPLFFGDTSAPHEMAQPDSAAIKSAAGDATGWAYSIVCLEQAPG